VNPGSFVLLYFASFVLSKLYFVCVSSCTVLFVSQVISIIFVIENENENEKH